MPNRKYFNAREKALIEQTRYVEVSYGSGQWIAFTLDHQDWNSRDTLGNCGVMGTVTSDTNTKGQKSKVISKGWTMRATPGNIRPVGSDWKVT